MGEIIVRKVRGMNWMAKISLVLIFTLVFSTFMYQGFYKPKQTEAAITRQANWAQQYANTAYPNGTINAAYAIGAGSNRLLLVAITSTRSTAGTQTVTVSYGGQNLTLAAGDAGTSALQHSYIYYLNEAGIQAAQAVPDDNLNVTVSGGTAVYTYVYAAVYAGVDQTTPLSDTATASDSTTSASNVVAYSPVLAINANEQAIEVVNLIRSTTGTTGRNISTWAAGWNATANVDQIYNPGSNNYMPHIYVNEYPIPGSNTTSNAAHAIDSANTYESHSAVSLKPYVCTPTGSLSVTAGQTLNGNPIDLTSITSVSNATNLLYTVLDTTGAGSFTSTYTGNTAGAALYDENDTLTAMPTTLAPSSALTATERTNISSDNGTNYSNPGSFGDRNAVRMALPVAETPSTIDSLVVTYNGTGENPLTLQTHVWNYTTSAWQQFGNTMAINTTDTTATATYVRAGGFADFVSGGTMNILVIDSTNANLNWTVDYLKLDVNYTIPPTQMFQGNATQAQTVDTTGWVNGRAYTLTLDGDDATCITPLTQASNTFTWNACSETATVAVAEPISSPISLPTSISATLGGSGGSNAEVSDDNATWHASPWTYTPPGPNQSGTVTFYARATGSCGTINDPTPVTVNYDTTNPTVTSTTPSNGATGVALNSSVTINWSENIDCTTVNTTNITISPAVGWVRTSCSGSQAVFTPSGQANNTAYTVTVGTGVKDLLGTNMAASYPFTYTTVLAAPTVGSTSPNSASQDTSLTVQVNGTYFVNGATVVFSGAGISVTNTTFVSASRIDVTITISAAAATGARDVTVTNPDLQSATLTNGFTVTPGTCVRNVPAVSLGANGSAAPGGSMVYTLTVTNADNSFCGNSTFTLGISSEAGNTGSFTLPSVFGSTTTGPLAPGANYNTTFTVTAQGGATVGHTLTSNVSATDNANHAGQPGAASVITVVTSPWANNSLLHNSVNMTANQSPKNYWAGQGGWGIPGGVYGGFSCETCHTRSTTNIGRIKQSITVPDISKGNIPGSAVNFQSKSGTANGFGDDQATHATSTRICEVCHTLPAVHKFNQSGSTLHENTATTPANYQDCVQCHEHKKGFALPGCLDCHAKQQGNRAAVVGQFSGNSHHIQGVTLSNTHCYQCHWEANANGSINYTYHLGWRNGQPATSNAAVDLVVWNATTRPGTYTVGTTAVQYNIVAGAAWRTTELPKINSHCIGCHNTPNDNIQPFGDGKTPKQYAWDGNSVGARYTQAGTTTWGKYTTFPNAAQKNATKALSAHGNAANNARGWNTTNGYDGAMVNTSGNVNVLCFDCHNSHGSSVAGTTSSYTSATTNGAILKDTTTGIGGYAVTYKPQVGGTVVDKNVRNAGASLCFDCHMTQVSGVTPWGYQETFGATQAIVGYTEKPYWYGAAGVNPAGAQQRYAYKNKIGSSGGHFGASSALGTSPMGTIGGLCTPCHDPHGVSPTDVGTCSNTAYYTKSTCTTNGGTWTANATTQAFGVPLLKGTWMTSPYKEDAAPANTTEARGGGRNTNPINVGSTPGYKIDQNTFPAAALPTTTPWRWNFAETAKLSQTDTQFGGLCLSCHAKADINPTTGASAWQGMDRIHNTVKGWGGAGANAGNAIHAFSCSKCHTPHNSCLPRLMVTNCIDSSHRGRVGQNGTVRTGANTYTGRQVGSAGAGIGRFPAGGGGYGSTGGPPDGWSSGAAGAYFFGNPGTSKTTPLTAAQMRACHDGSNTTWPDEKWNTKTPWTAP